MWRHQMEAFSALLAICAGNSPVPGEFPTQRPMTRSFDVYFDLRLDKRLCKQSWGWWFETLLCPLWRHSDAITTRYAILIRKAHSPTISALRFSIRYVLSRHGLYASALYYCVLHISVFAITHSTPGEHNKTLLWLAISKQYDFPTIKSGFDFPFETS